MHKKVNCCTGFDDACSHAKFYSKFHGKKKYLEKYDLNVTTIQISSQPKMRVCFWKTRYL